MPLLRGICVFLVFLALGELAKYWLGWPLSGGVTGMLLLTAWLALRGRVTDDVAAASDTLIALLIVLIMPGVVGVFFLGKELTGQWFTLVLAYVGGTALSVLSTFFLLMRFARSGTAVEGDQHG